MFVYIYTATCLCMCKNCYIFSVEIICFLLPVIINNLIKSYVFSI